MRQPTRELARLTGLPLFVEYKMPNGVTAEELETVVKEENYSDNLFQTFLRERLVPLNPELAVFKDLGAEFCYYVVMGVTSGFTVDDIAHFISFQRKVHRGVPDHYIDLMHSHALSLRVSRIDGWRPSPASFNMLCNYFGISRAALFIEDVRNWLHGLTHPPVQETKCEHCDHH